ncbi:hypothetical protein M434DRAFT_26456 [Hypoxylon sp. CO27-5]|nr:hypothetical protein M434DRAFT_26456 [Hypoxylon sp. CO27-5]
MPRRWPVDGDRDSDDRLPAGFERIGYDADDGVYTYRAPDGSIWKGLSGNRYGELTQVQGADPVVEVTNVERQRSPTPPPPPTEPNPTQQKIKRSKTSQMLENSVLRLGNIARDIRERAKKRREERRKKAELRRQQTINSFLNDGDLNDVGHMEFDKMENVNWTI